jgi:hypothetical protein
MPIIRSLTAAAASGLPIVIRDKVCKLTVEEG